MSIPAWKSFSPLKKILTGLTAIVSLIAISLGWFWSQDVEFVIPSTRISYECVAGKSVLKVLLANYAAKIQESSLGALVLEIDGVAQGGGKYWQYQIDKKEATIGAQAYICQGQEQILWELK